MVQRKKGLRIKFTKTVGVIALAILISSCGYKTVYVPHGDAVRLRERVKNVKVWVKTKDGDIVPGKMDLPDGWYCLPLDDEKEK